MKFLLSMLMMSMTASLSWAQVSLTGSVLGNNSKSPIEGVVVRLPGLNMSDITDEEGKFEFKGVNAGTYTLLLRHISYDTKQMTLPLEENTVIKIVLDESTLMSDEVIITSTRASANMPVTYSNLEKEEISKLNNAQDIPYILNFTPSVVSTSDAGAGIGYSGIRIRGSDATRINVTINGIPLNDSESQGVFWVNTPDLASSTQSIQVQRGVGTSTNGAGAFGGTINLETTGKETEPQGTFTNTFGSFNTRRHTLSFGTGLIKDHWSIDGRFSKIKSDGYIDRASSDLDSYYFSGGYYSEKTMIKAIVFGGAEVTYQSWYGTPEAVLENDLEGIEAVIINNGLDEEQAENMRNAGRTFNWYLYDDQVDDYKQDHYQLHLSHRFNTSLTGTMALHYTYGRGFFEQFRRGDEFEDYGVDAPVIGDSTLSTTDLVRRRWLDNHFYGVTYSLQYQPASSLNVTLGGGWNYYDGDHFGEVIWSEVAVNLPKEFRYYDNTGTKEDFNTYLKAEYTLNDKLSMFGDIQYRMIDYQVQGIDNDLRPLDIDQQFHFFNPKFGATYNVNSNSSLYGSFAVANREPVRSDFIDSPELPEEETLRNVELGYRYTGKVSFEANAYLMDYKDQLVLTGELNDVGSALRRNVANSYRTGLELQARMALTNNLIWEVNSTFSRNKIDEFTEVIYDYGEAFDEFNIIENTYSNTDIAFSPEIVAASQLSWSFLRNIIGDDSFELTLLSKYVGDQFLDNTSNENRKISAYFVNDLRLRYVIQNTLFDQVSLIFLINNVFDEAYVSNGYTFGYQGGPDYVVRENYYYPQALRNYLITLAIDF
jgi:iron complex outermembrane receptor protein